ncbi:MAG: TraR/DksA C4-type zinc finger protein, partial [Terriglobia bacterium]
MVTAIEPLLREQLIDRRQKLEIASRGFIEATEISHLLAEVDEALRRMELGTYGLCDFCNDPVETERLIANPLTRLCIDHLSPKEQRALEDDLELAARIQTGLLPLPSQRIDGWEIAYHYQP